MCIHSSFYATSYWLRPIGRSQYNKSCLYLFCSTFLIFCSFFNVCLCLLELFRQNFRIAVRYIFWWRHLHVSQQVTSQTRCDSHYKHLRFTLKHLWFKCHRFSDIGKDVLMDVVVGKLPPCHCVSHQCKNRAASTRRRPIFTKCHIYLANRLSSRHRYARWQTDRLRCIEMCRKRYNCCAGCTNLIR